MKKEIIHNPVTGTDYLVKRDQKGKGTIVGKVEMQKVQKSDAKTKWIDCDSEEADFWCRLNRIGEER